MRASSRRSRQSEVMRVSSANAKTPAALRAAGVLPVPVHKQLRFMTCDSHFEDPGFPPFCQKKGERMGHGMEEEQAVRNRCYSTSLTLPDLKVTFIPL
jgi:hypothetical protein